MCMVRLSGFSVGCLLPGRRRQPGLAQRVAKPALHPAAATAAAAAGHLLPASASVAASTNTGTVGSAGKLASAFRHSP